ncbi:MAG TPA: TOBE domain-containing protein [Bacillota bacterium]|jgi:molybdopterin-binding protein|nr:TOBE domain-containing protein [Peptococcaceae bacterium MAG4]NLW38568.1 TOBE domain-containing protein [Peptococcaceae bacterium]HPZ42814.1 TOBE domain-containing protein [Bacillota bacterium]HQD75309.1 TOBE domain-containing protein [Bacillota bacterium]HUM58099.1 TOBE domain-containing protein [Bacillota bacterium]
MELSARNNLKARIKDIKTNDISAEVLLDVGGQEMCSSLTADSVKRLGLSVGDQVNVLIKASSVMLGK